MPRRTAKTMRRRVKSASKKMAQSVRMRRGAPAKKNVSKKKTQKAKKSGNDWNKHVMQVFAELRAKNPDAKLGDAMKAAKKTYKKEVKPVSAVPTSQFETVTMPKKKGKKPVSAVPSSQFETVTMPKKKKSAKKSGGSKSKSKRRSRRR